MRALVIEDFAPLRAAIAELVESLGWEVDRSSDGRDGLWQAESTDYDVIVLDLMLPGLHGLEVLRRLRAKGNESAVLILSAVAEVEDRVTGLQMGADDYLTKPFANAELKARVETLARRRGPTRAPVLTAGSLRIDSAARSVTRGGEPIETTAREFAVLEFLARHPGQVVTRTQLWENLYGFDAEGQSNVIDVYVSALRRKLETPGAGHEAWIHTRRGQGYLFEARVSEPEAAE